MIIIKFPIDLCMRNKKEFAIVLSIAVEMVRFMKKAVIYKTYNVLFQAIIIVFYIKFTLKGRVNKSLIAQMRD